MLRINYNSLHKLLCNLHGQPSSPSDFEDALQKLESGFVSINGQKVKFINPSLNDFLNVILADFEFLKNLPEAAKRADWARSLWRYGKMLLEDQEQNLEEFAKKFFNFAKIIDRYPSTKVIKLREDLMFKRDDLSLAERVAFLCDLAFECGDLGFLEFALSILNSDRLKIVPEDDARTGIELHKKICVSLDESSVLRPELLEGVERLILNAIGSGLNLEELVGVIEVAKKFFGDEAPMNVQDAIDNAVLDVENQIGIDQGLAELFLLIDKLEELTGGDASELKEIISKERGHYEFFDYDEYEFSGYPRASGTPNESFDNFELNSLFTTLIQK